MFQLVISFVEKQKHMEKKAVHISVRHIRITFHVYFHYFCAEMRLPPTAAAYFSQSNVEYKFDIKICFRSNGTDVPSVYSTFLSRLTVKTLPPK